MRRLALYSSKTGSDPNLVALQDEALDFLPTILVCPLKKNVSQTIVRAKLQWQDGIFFVLCELARPINRRLLRHVGRANEIDSMQIVATFLKVLGE